MFRVLSFCIVLSLLLVPVMAFDFESGDWEVFEDEVAEDALFDPVPVLIIDGSTSDLVSHEELQSALDEQSAALIDAITAVEPAAVSALDTPAYSFEADTALGHLSFYLPAGTPAQPFILSGSQLLNGTSGTLYLYSPSYPGYTFQASRFSAFQYRTNTTTTNPWYDLRLSNVTGLSGLPAGSGVNEMLPTVCLVIIAAVAICVFPKAFGRS